MRASFHQQKSPAAAEADGRMAEIPQKKKGSDMQAPFTTTIFPSRDWARRPRNARAQGESAAGAPSGHRRAGKSSSPLEHPSRPGRPSAPETVPIGWDWRRLGGMGGGCLTSPHAAIPSFCKTTDPSGPAVDQSHLLGRPSQCLLRPVRCSRYFCHGRGVEKLRDSHCVLRMLFLLVCQTYPAWARPARWRL